MQRRDGVIEVRMHTNGGPASITGGHSPEVWSQAWWNIGNDLENKVMILTGTGDRWLAEPEGWPDFGNENEPQIVDQDPTRRQRSLLASRKIAENFLFGIDIPTIGAINGPGVPGFHYEFALYSDITLCTDDTVLWDPHSLFGFAPGDGLGFAFQELLGTKRAAYYLYTSSPIDASSALRLGLVNEVLPRERLLPRAWEIAEHIMRIPPASRMMTKAIVQRPWLRRHVDDSGFHLAHEMFGIFIDRAGFGGFHRAHERATRLLEERGLSRPEDGAGSPSVKRPEA